MGRAYTKQIQKSRRDEIAQQSEFASLGNIEQKIVILLSIVEVFNVVFM